MVGLYLRQKPDKNQTFSSGVLARMAFAALLLSVSLIVVHLATSILAANEFEKGRDAFLRHSNLLSEDHDQLFDLLDDLEVNEYIDLIQMELLVPDAERGGVIEREKSQFIGTLLTLRGLGLSDQQKTQLSLLENELDRIDSFYQAVLENDQNRPAVTELLYSQRNISHAITTMRQIARSDTEALLSGFLGTLQSTRNFFIISAMLTPFLAVLTIVLLLLSRKLRQAIVERNAAQEKLQTLNKSLESRVAVRTREIQRQEAILRSTYEAVPVMLAYLDSDFVFRRVNAAQAKALGVGVDDIVGQSLKNMLLPAQYEGLRNVLKKVDGNHPVSEVIPMKTDNGQQMYMHIDVVPDMTKNGKLKGYHTACRNVTRQKVLEEDLVRATEEAVHSNNMKSRFLAQMSHELRTPLNAIIGFSEIMQLGYYGPLNKKYQEYSEHIHVSASHLLSLINDLLDLSKIEAGKYDLSETSFEVSSIVEETRSMLAHLAERRNIALNVEPSTFSAAVFADRRALLQVLVNLTSNALRYSDGGDCVEILQSVSKNGGLEICIADNGPGIAASDMENILNPFVRGQHTRTKDREGTGLGLSVSKALVERHGGELMIESMQGQGTRVRIFIPAERVTVDHEVDPQEEKVAHLKLV